jgi:hypothetical protein
MTAPSSSGVTAGNNSDDLLGTLADAMTFVKSIEENNSISALTLDSLLQSYINSLQGTPPGSATANVASTVVDPEGNTLYTKPTRYDQLTALQNSIDTACTAIQKAGTDPAKLAALGLNPLPPA